MVKVKPEYVDKYKAFLAARNIILLATGGSELLGMSNDQSDKDLIGIYIEPINKVMGFQLESTVTYRSATERTGQPDTPSEPGDVDITLYGLRTFLKLALGGNPTIISTLYTPEKLCPILTDAGAELQALAPKIISKLAGKAFLGYMNSQRMRLIGAKGQKNVNRRDLVERFGFDTHYAMHMQRLGYQGIDLMTKGELTFPLSNGVMSTLKAISNGEYTLNNCIQFVDDLDYTLKANMITSTLQDGPDYDVVEEWMLKVYKDAWGKE